MAAETGRHRPGRRRLPAVRSRRPNRCEGGKGVCRLRSGRSVTRWQRAARLAACLAFLLFIASPPQPQSAASARTDPQSETLFRERCSPCHTIGGGIRVGPDLLGVTQRRDRDWLLRWIKEPNRVLAEKDPIATQLLQEFNNVAMPNMGLTDEQVAALVAYLESRSVSSSQAQTEFPALYVPTLAFAVALLAVLTVTGLLAARKTVEVRP